MVIHLISKNITIIIALVVTAFIALGFVQVTYQGQMKQALDNQGVQLSQLEEGRRQADVRGNETLAYISKSLMAMNNSITESIRNDANLSKVETLKLIGQIREIPGIVSALKNITSTVNIDTKGAVIHRNLTTDNYNNIRELIGRMQNMDNKLNELFFERSSDDPATHVYNATEGSNNNGTK